MNIMKFELLNDSQIEAIKGGARDRIFNLNPQLNIGGALATRGVLIAEGIASPRIVVRALGASPPIADGPPDRADLAITLPRPAP
jgi:hypothetical protein